LHNTDFAQVRVSASGIASHCAIIAHRIRALRTRLMLSASDRFVDISLRILTLVVGAVLLACLGLLTYRWTVPPRVAPTVKIVPVVPRITPAPVIPAAVPARAPEVLMAPGKMFRCVVNGRALFSDRPCEEVVRTSKKQ
jgi:hypothetical protein